MNEAQIIIREWGLDGSGLHSKEDIINALARRVDQMLQDNPMEFIQLMYRLDISEGALDAALQAEHAALCVATLIWDRQIQKITSRQNNPFREKKAEDEDLEW